MTNTKNITQTLTQRLRRAFHRLDNWTLTVFNPRLPSDKR